MEDLAGGPMLRPPGIAPAGTAGTRVSGDPAPALPSTRSGPRPGCERPGVVSPAFSEDHGLHS